jgi:flagellar biosynthesis protein FlhF
MNERNTMAQLTRTFRASDARGALAQVKAALGPDAVIVSTREVSGGLFRQKEVEVVASLTSPEAPPERTATPMARAEESKAELAQLRDMLEAMRAEVRSLSRPEPKPTAAPEATELLGRLAQRGVERTIAQEITHQACAKGRAGSSVLLAARDAIGERLISGRAPWLRDHKKAIALVGPTGVGKTTTLAKIAARAVMESKLQVALITIDTYRIGACEQVARYGEIMKLPTHVARDQRDLAKALTACSGADLVLIDTAGRSLPEAVAQQAELLRAIPQLQLYLVLSAATGPRELAGAADRYRAMRPERLLFTKLDEAIAPGSVLSASMRIGRPVVALADGQRVPEDLHATSNESLIELVLGEPSAARAAGGF